MESSNSFIPQRRNDEADDNDDDDSSINREDNEKGLLGCLERTMNVGM